MKEKLGTEPAFPFQLPDYGHSGIEIGITKRFYAACAAMQGILSANPKETWGNIEIPIPKYVAELSFEFADELLKQEQEEK